MVKYPINEQLWTINHSNLPNPRPWYDWGHPRSPKNIACDVHEKLSLNLTALQAHREVDACESGATWRDDHVVNAIESPPFGYIWGIICARVNFVYEKKMAHKS